MGGRDQADFGPMLPDLSIIIVEKDRDRALRIVDALTETGDYRITVLSDAGSLARRNADRRPDVVLIDVASPSRDVLEELTLASGTMDRPVTIFVDRSDPGITRAAIKAGGRPMSWMG